MIRRPPRSTQSRSSAASDVYKRQPQHRLLVYNGVTGYFQRSPTPNHAPTLILPTPILIISDSLAALSSISIPSLHSLTERIHPLPTTFASNHTPITFIWAPGHNSDLFLLIKRFIHVSWVSHWEKQTPISWPHSKGPPNQPFRYLEITPTRLRIGHTRLTPTHLLTHLAGFLFYI